MKGSPFALALVAALTVAAPAASAADPPPLDVRRAPVPENDLRYRQELPYPTLPWLALQLVPSPEFAFGRQRHVGENGTVDKSISTAFGLRWQLTPFLWSFGVHRSQTRWRAFVVDPLARQSGSIELSTSFEYIGGDVNGLIARPGLRVYLPLSDRGENLSMSLGTSAYRFDGFRVAYDVGVYILSGFLGVQFTVAPTHAPLATIATIRLRYF